MTDVKWIKFKVGTFDGKSFKKIKRAKIGGESYRDKLTAIWFELMDFAGKCNHSGAFIDSHEIPFTSLEDIAIMIDREPDELELCMSFFVNEGMVDVIDDIYMLSNWATYQSEDSLERIREKNRIRQARFREKKRLLVENVSEDNGNSNDTVTLHNALDKDKEEDKDIDKDIEKEEETPAAPPPPLPSPKKGKQVKHKHGEYKNVLLTEEELDKLKSEFSDWETRIDRLSSYIASTGKAYKSHYVTIKNWARRDAETGYQGKKTKAPAQTFVPGEEEKMAIERLRRERADFERLKKFREELRTAGNDPEIAARAENLKKQLGG